MIEQLITACKCEKAIQSIGMHRHHAYELFFVQSGCILLTVNQAAYKMMPGCLAFISCEEAHSIEVLEEPENCYFVLVHPSYVDSVRADPRLLSVFKQRSVNFYHCVDLCSQSGNIVRLFDRMRHEFDKPTDFSEELLSGYMKELLIMAYRVTPAQHPASAPKRINPAVLSIRNDIDKNYTAMLSLQSLAEAHYLSVDYMSHNFKELTGRSPQKYILYKRLQHSKQLLRETNQSVSSIAYQSGFSDVNSFIRVFKKYVGTTPNKYRSV